MNEELRKDGEDVIYILDTNPMKKLRNKFFYFISMYVIATNLKMCLCTEQKSEPVYMKHKYYIYPMFKTTVQALHSNN